MTRVALSAPIAEGVALQIDRELDRLHLMIGQWVIELIGGKLIVRPEEDTDAPAESEDVPF